MIFTAYVMFVQGSQLASEGFAIPTINPLLNLENLSAYFSRPAINLPRFEGIELPMPPKPKTVTEPSNPFGGSNIDDDGFDDFQDFSSGTLPV